MPGVSEPPGQASRRQFLQISGALLAMGGLAACEPAQNVLPYARKPEEVIPGVARYYATSMPFRGSVEGLLVESNEGRPTKIEGNPQHPTSGGSSGHFAQASVLNLYDPQRSGQITREGSADATWQDFVNYARALTSRTPRLAVISEPTSSPTVQALREQLAENANLTWVTFAPEGEDPAEQAMRQAAGRPLRPVYRFDEAEVIASLDADFLGPTAKNYVKNTARFAESRRLESPDDTMSRFYAAESDHSITGGMADHRLPVRSSDVPQIAQALASALGAGGGSAQLTHKQRQFVEAMAQDLQGAGEQGLVVAGETQPPAVHALAMAINEQLGATGTTLRLLDPQSGGPGGSANQQTAGTGESATRPNQTQQLARLTQQMQAGQVDALLVLGANPVYHAPPELNFSAAMQRVPETIHVGLHRDETAQEASWHLPRAHFLESWGDGRAYDGTLSIIQPLIAPLYDQAHSDVEIMNLLANGLNEPGYDVVRRRWREQLAGSGSAGSNVEGDGFGEKWRRVLHDGFVPDSQYTEAGGGIGGGGSPSLPSAPAGDELEVVLRLSPKVLDGSFANNPWAQELPHPTTKLVWDNAAIMSPSTARDLGVSAAYDEGDYYADVVELSANGQTVTLPVWEHPGHADNSISVAMGYGRNLASTYEGPEEGWFDFFDAYDSVWETSEPLANGVGASVAPLRPVDGGRVVTGVSVKPTGEQQMVATTQDHGALDTEARPLFRMASMEEYKENPDFVQHQGEPSPTEESFDEYPMLWQDEHPQEANPSKDNPYHQNQWGMVIDLNTCTGCNACITACNTENNIQVVGKEQVANGREMMWLRMDRYFVTDEGFEEEDIPPDPNMVTQPVPCMHCENAPCESVCPVAATVHSDDGTNQMIYNRCVGTRYCSNNCPYKVRRFNYYKWSQSLPAEMEMAQNPDVTMRSRGVMEKCSYCIQRIRETGRRAQLEEREIRDGEVQTACQQACPADAITFGDQSDPTTKVSKKKENARRYEMLDELNVKPRTSYLGRVRNLSDDLAPASSHGKTEPQHEAAPAEGDAHS
jgi:molybdopterin-containing oxidoreductase family iron-sulfur binding subunit